MSDLISRQAAIKAICEKECDVLKPCKAECESIWAVKELPSVHPELANNSPKFANENDELISRQHFDSRVRSAVGMVEEDLTDDFKDGILAVLDLLKKEPSIEPRKGRWIEESEDWRNQITWWQCSKCGTPSSYKSNFCPNCGCRMEEGESDEVN